MSPPYTGNLNSHTIKKQAIKTPVFIDIDIVIAYNVKNADDKNFNEQGENIYGYGKDIQQDCRRQWYKRWRSQAGNTGSDQGCIYKSAKQQRNCKSIPETYSL